MMIRIIELRGQNVGAAFAIFDTVTDEFVEFNDNYLWKSKEDLEVDIESTRAAYAITEKCFVGDDWVECFDNYKERILGLLPGWTRGYGVPDDDY